jgi:histidine decarboxylase
MITLDELHRRLIRCTRLHTDYSYHLRDDPTPVLPFFQYTLNSVSEPCSGPCINSNYKLNSKEFEQACLAWFANLYQLNDYWGYVTTSRTEGNLNGILLGREQYPNGILYSSQDTHYSVSKAAQLFRIEHLIIDSQPNGELDYDHLETQLRSHRHRPAILNLNLGTTLKGAIDRVDRVLDILEQLQITQFYIHCDATLGGMLLPFLEGAPQISFQKPIGSIAVSSYKFIGAPIPCGIILTRRAYAPPSEQVDDLDGQGMTMLGSRNGLAPTLLWQAIATRGNDFQQEAATCLTNARYLYQRLIDIDYPAMLNNHSITVVLKKPGVELCQKWQLLTFGSWTHVVVLQHVTPEKIDEFVHDLTQETPSKLFHALPDRQHYQLPTVVAKSGFIG